MILVICSVLFVLCAGVRDPEEELDLFEGDIELPPVTGFRSAINQKEKLWPGGVVPYQYDDERLPISDEQKVNLSLAMQDIMEHTCIKFKYTTDPDVTEFLKIQRTRAGCSSSLGMMDRSLYPDIRGQTIRYSDECFQKVGSLTHELMHSLGFFHEQSRYDRDEYVKIVPQNVDQGKIRQFRLHTLSEQNVKLGAPYDFGSIMHYPSWAFSRGSEDTIIPLYEAEIGQREKLSDTDIWKVNKLYNCPNVGPAPVVDYGKKKEIDESSLYALERSFYCDFEFGWPCSMRDELDSEFDWAIGRGQISTYFETGPKAGVDGKQCCYLYLDAIAKDQGSSATVVSPPMQPTLEEGSCFTFHYHMYGKTMGTLNVFWRKIGSSEVNLLVTEHGNHGDKWIKSSHVLHVDAPFEVVFRGSIGEEEMAAYEGYIALDNIELFPMIRLKYKGKTCGQ